MTRLRLPQKFVSNWLLGTAIFVMGWSIYLSYTICLTWSFVGMMGGMIMLHLQAETEGQKLFSPWVLYPMLLTLLTVAVNMALASLGICEDGFGLLG